MMDFSDQCHQSSRFSFLQLLEENNWRIEELQSFDPFRSKLCGLEEQPTQEAEQHNIAQEQFVETPHMQVDSISRETCEVQTQHPNYAEDSVLLTSTVASDEICGKSNPMTSDHDETPMQANSGSNSKKPLDNRLATSDNFMCGGPSKSSSGTCTQSKRKRKRSNKCSKNSQEVESQRQTHIAVERNRRKQMNEHLSILRSLMPGSYVLRGDQASIVGGAIEFVKELEQLLECLQVQKRRRTYAKAFSPKPSILLQPTFPVYSLPSEQSQVYSMSADSKYVNDNFYEPVMREVFAESKSGLAEVEVKVVGSVAFVKILSQRRPGQLLKTIEALEGLCLTIVHTNITTIEQTVLYSFNVTLGAECILKVDEIAAAVQHIFTMIHNSSSTMRF
ncbi:hypothetical protein O6H91_13G066300 [Diphasiastrum complanatum]|uniref:Uncharacterized protein n=2 Tax=Diphasiastrum complanatum TaxID=34168 RepID=A0ACC2BW17_DIPCM|nr:hypothetical protein O6H91_Y382700 [Diphasiastrum complanatum]KAJ7533813.1 hypothetical protein O6H91_13G066300 [Diphasiastrum complanatum]KAJ7533814.1 hypothetical protein O6H91_13G066300 [Diphasiastrum complanatum]